MKVGLFIPCYVDALYPHVGIATYKLLKQLGVEVEYPQKQTCCGQPMGNAGFQQKAEKLVEDYDKLFAEYDYVVAPSASCAAYVRFFHPGIVNHECRTEDNGRSRVYPRRHKAKGIAVGKVPSQGKPAQ